MGGAVDSLLADRPAGADMQWGVSILASEGNKSANGMSGSQERQPSQERLAEHEYLSNGAAGVPVDGTGKADLDLGLLASGPTT